MGVLTGYSENDPVSHHRCGLCGNCVFHLRQLENIPAA